MAVEKWDEVIRLVGHCRRREGKQDDDDRGDNALHGSINPLIRIDGNHHLRSCSFGSAFNRVKKMIPVFGSPLAVTRIGSIPGRFDQDADFTPPAKSRSGRSLRERLSIPHDQSRNRQYVRPASSDIVPWLRRRRGHPEAEVLRCLRSVGGHRG